EHRGRPRRDGNLHRPLQVGRDVERRIVFDELVSERGGERGVLRALSSYDGPFDLGHRGERAQGIQRHEARKLRALFGSQHPTEPRLRMLESLQGKNGANLVHGCPPSWNSSDYIAKDNSLIDSTRTQLVRTGAWKRRWRRSERG